MDEKIAYTFTGEGNSVAGRRQGGNVEVATVAPPATVVIPTRCRWYMTTDRSVVTFKSGLKHVITQSLAFSL
jgi:hypothetical protein